MFLGVQFHATSDSGGQGEEGDGEAGVSRGISLVQKCADAISVRREAEAK